VKRAIAFAAAAVALAAPGVAGAAAHPKSKRTVPFPITLLQIRTVPAIPNALFTLDGRDYRTDRAGMLTIKARNLAELSGRLHPHAAQLGPNVLYRFKVWRGHLDQRPGRRHGSLYPTKRLSATYDVYYRVRFQFVDDATGRRPPNQVSRVTLRSSTGVLDSFTPTSAPVQERWFWGRRVVTNANSLQVKTVYWVVDDVTIDGSNVVNSSQQKIVPASAVKVVYPIRLLYHGAVIRSRDALFPANAGSKVELRFPNGVVRTYRLSHGRLDLPSLPRGHYDVKPVGFGVSFWSPVELSRDQTIDLKLITYLDLAVIAILVGGLAFALAAVRRPALRRRAVAAITLSRAGTR
jgi:hypothetical protein